MIDPKKSANIDQATSFMTEVLPSLWRRLYLRLIEEGFNESDSLTLLKVYIKASSTPSST